MELKCDGGDGGESSQQNDSGGPSSSSSSSSFDLLDASLFYASAPSDDADLSVTSDVGRSSSPVFALSDITDGVDADLLRTVFLLSDLVVLVYRLTATYVTARALRRRFASCPAAAAAAARRRPPPAGPAADSGSTLRSSSSRTALTSTSVVPDAGSNIYVDPQSLVVDNCASLVRRSGASCVDASGAACPRRFSDVARYSSGSSGRCVL